MQYYAVVFIKGDEGITYLHYYYFFEKPNTYLHSMGYLW
jgi:hypothetical protein